MRRAGRGVGEQPAGVSLLCDHAVEGVGDLAERSTVRPADIWSTFGPHAIGAERFPAVSSSSQLRRWQVRSWGNRPGGRTLIRMRSQDQVLAGPPPDLAGHDPAGSGLGGMNVSFLAFAFTFWRHLKRHVGCNATASPQYKLSSDMPLKEKRRNRL
jgi:hypothetical protein